MKTTINTATPVASGAFMVMMPPEQFAAMIKSDLGEPINRLVEEVAAQRAELEKLKEETRLVAAAAEPPRFREKELTTAQAMERLGMSCKKAFFKTVERLGIPRAPLSGRNLRFFEDDIDAAIYRARTTQSARRKRSAQGTRVYSAKPKHSQREEN